jgi:hypothetical protein
MALETFQGTITVPNTGTLPVARTVSGLAFQPKLVIFYSASVATFDTTNTHVRDCVGAARSSTEQFCIAMASDGAGITAANSGRFARYGTECIGIPSNGTPAIDALATFVQFNADGFQVNFTDLASAAGMEVGYLAIGGSDITNVGFQQVTPVSTTNGATQAINFGFAPDCVLFFSPAVPSTTAIVDANTCIGVATRVTAQQYTSFWFENDAAANMGTAVYSTDQRCHSQPAATPVKDADASIQSWDADGVTLVWNDAVGATTARIYAIGIRGGNWELEKITAPTSAGSVNYPTTYAPKGLFSFGTSDPTDTDTTASVAAGDACMILGAADSGLRQGGVSYIQTNGNATSVAQRQQSKTALSRWLTGTGGTLAASGQVTTLGASSFDINWTTATAGTRRLVALVMADGAAAPTPTPPALVMAPMVPTPLRRMR